MDSDQFNDIIDFAVHQEEIAVAFYRECLKIISGKEEQEVLREFEQMEKNHIKILEGIRKRGAEHITIPAIPDIMIKDEAPARPSSDTDIRGIVQLGLEREQKSLDLYSRLAESSSDPELEKIFTSLAAEEAKHKLYLDTLYNAE